MPVREPLIFSMGQRFNMSRSQHLLGELCRCSRSRRESAKAGILLLRKQISERNHRKPKLTFAEVKSWIQEGRR